MIKEKKWEAGDLKIQQKMRANQIEIQTAAQLSIHEPINNDEEKAVDFCELGQSDFVVALRCADIVVSFFSWCSSFSAAAAAAAVAVTAQHHNL